MSSNNFKWRGKMYIKFNQNGELLHLNFILNKKNHIPKSSPFVQRHFLFFLLLSCGSCVQRKAPNFNNRYWRGLP